METLIVQRENNLLFVTLNRPEVRNAMNLKMAAELGAVLAEAESDESMRGLILRGYGGHFCAGGDVSEMAHLAQHPDEAATVNRAFGHMLEMANGASFPIIVVLEGAVLGGGFGLACISDIAIAHREATFGLPETGLGLIPAQIAPFVVARIGLTKARRLGLFGNRFDGESALDLGVVHFCLDDSDQIDRCLAEQLALLKRCAPQANRTTKRLLLQAANLNLGPILDDAAQSFANCLQGEGQEGMAAFREKRKPRWMES